MPTVDYTNALNRYQLNRGINSQAMAPQRNATGISALGRILASYFASKGMTGAEHGMQQAEQTQTNNREMDLSRALGAFRGDTPYQMGEEELFPGEAPIEGLRNMGTGADRGAMAQALMAAKTPGLQEAGLSMLAQKPESPDIDKKIMAFEQAKARGLIDPNMSFVDFAKISVPNTNINIGDGPKLPAGYQWKDVNDTSKGVIPIAGSDKDPKVRNQQDLDKLNLVSQKVEGALDRYEAQFDKTGTKILPDADKMATTTAYKDLMLQLKELFNLGVLNGPDLEIMEAYVADPTTGMAVFMEAVGGREGFKRQLQLVRDKVQSEVKINRGILRGGEEQGGIPTVTTQEEFDALPSGAEFIENGVPYRKP